MNKEFSDFLKMLKESGLIDYILELSEELHGRKPIDKEFTVVFCLSLLKIYDLWQKHQTVEPLQLSDLTALLS